MSDDVQFLSDVKALSDNGTLKRLLEMIEQDCVDRWKVATESVAREQAWHDLQAISRLQGRMASLGRAEDFANFNLRNRRRIS